MNNIMRIITGVIGFTIVAILLIFGNTYLIDLIIAIVAAMTLHEFYKSFKGKANPITWIGYVASALIAVMHILPNEYLIHIIGILIPIFILILFIQSIVTNIKVNIIDISITMLGICYITLFIMFLPILRGINNGKFLLWYVLFSAWGTDVFAYIFGKTIGKHKFCKVSPNKTVEGAIGGVIGALVINLVYTFAINSLFDLGISYVAISIIVIILSVLSQIGDLSASTIKRYVGIKDFSNLLPGHGGLLDRIDSLVFIAPFAFYLLRLLA